MPYRQEEVTFKNGDTTLAGTLTLPEGKGPFPAVILLSGSGQQNRDEEISIAPGYKPFRVIADTLTRQGIAVLRYDDRGIGQSGGDPAKPPRSILPPTPRRDSTRFWLTRKLTQSRWACSATAKVGSSPPRWLRTRM